jgi:hypothetical protein
VDARYQKNLTMRVLFEHQPFFDGNLIDDRSNASNPGGTDIFGRGASTENPGFHVERYWIDYKFAGTPFRMRVGTDLWTLDQAGLVGDDDPRFALFATFGNVDLTAAAVVQRESQRLGLQNDNDFIYYTFSGGYTLKPHRFQLDVTYFRDRFYGAETQSSRSNLGFHGQKTDSVLLGASWTGTIGPVRGLLQGNLVTGNARGGLLGLPAGAIVGRDYDILAGGVVAYGEVDLGIVKPFVMLVFASGDGDPSDNKLHGFAAIPQGDISLMTGRPLFAHLTTSVGIGVRDYSCPGRLQGMRASAPASNPLAIGTSVTEASAGGGFSECGHTVGNPLNDRIGQISHPGIRTTYSNPGVLMIPVGLQIFPAKGHQISAWYIYRAMATSRLLEIAFAPELAGRSIGKTQYHELGAFWMWTLNPHFDFRLSGGIGIAGDGYKDLARLADCNPNVAGVQSCSADDVALTGEVRFRARF